MDFIKLLEVLLQIMGALYLRKIIAENLLGWVAYEERKEMRRLGDTGDVVYVVAPRARFFKALWIVLIVTLVLALNYRT